MCLGIELKHGLGHYMRRVMTDGGKDRVVLGGQQCQRGIGLDLAGQVPFLAVHNGQHRRFGKAGADIGGDGGR